MKWKGTEVYYGWFVVAAAFLIMAVGWGSVYNCSSLFINPISAELGFSRSAINFTMTIRAACQMGISLFAGKIFRSFQMMKLMKVFSVVLVFSFFLYSLAHSLWAFYLISVLVSIAITMITILPLSIILSNWFVKGRGGAIGIAFMGSGVGGMILSSLTGIWIQDFGWRTAYQILSGLMVVFIIPSVFFLLKAHPREMGLNPHGVTREGAKAFHAAENSGIMLAEAMKSIRFWGLNLSAIFLLIGINALMMNVAPHLIELGYPITFSANVVALTMGSLAIGKVVLGKLYDRLGLKTATMIACLANLFALTGLLFARSYIGLAVTIIFVGIGCAYATIANSVLTIELFGKKDYNAIFGFLTAIGAIGSVTGPILTGYLYDTMGDYTSSFMVSILLCIAAIIIYLAIFSGQQFRKSHQTA